MNSTHTRDMGDDIKLRGVFNDQAVQYNEVRPRYPEKLFEVLINKTQLKSDARLLEIGPGTGQATLPLAQRGYNIVAVELGAQLAKVARELLSAFPAVKVVTGAFEDTELPAHGFDLIYSATAFHWVRHDVRYTRPHSLLKPKGYLAVIGTNHVSDEKGDLFFHASQPIYDRYTPKSNDEFLLPQTKDLKPMGDLDVQLFDLVHFECFPLEIEYDAEEYIKLLGTYSPHLALDDETRKAFFGDIKKLISERFDGKIKKHYSMSLTVVQAKELV